MLSRVRSAVAHLVSSGDPPGSGSNGLPTSASPDPVAHPGTPRSPPAGAESGNRTFGGAVENRGSSSRPTFLQLSPRGLRRAEDHAGRAVQSPPDTGRRLPWRTGYAEVINAGKSRHNEDQACCEVVYVEGRESRTGGPGKSIKDQGHQGLYFHYWGLFDGHAGGRAAEMASRLLHRHIREQLRGLVEILQDPSPPPVCLPSTTEASASLESSYPSGSQPCWPSQKEVTHENLVVGAIENAFQFMDEHMAREQRNQYAVGGCCALVSVYLLGKMYVANAGDSRAIIVRNGDIIPMSREFTPETERQRLQLLGFLKPELLGNEFTYLQFPRRVHPKELGQRMLYQDQCMTGWAYKKIELQDLRFPLVCGEGKQARVLATIGVTRGLGDHNLKVASSALPVKPFLSCFPEVQVYDLTQYEHCPDDVLILGNCPDDVLILGTDGLWDVSSDKDVAATVGKVLSSYEPNDPSRYTALAQALVLGARGISRGQGWRRPNNKMGSGDDISVFVIPLGGPGGYT